MLMAVGYVPDMTNPTVAEFDQAAHVNAFAFWFWTGSAGFVGLELSPWWAIIPVIVATHAAVCWSLCSRHARCLKGEMPTVHSKNYLEARDTGRGDDQLAA
jgi:hypothetical protein